MSDQFEPRTGLDLAFRNPLDEAHARAQEFRRLVPEERWRRIAELRNLGLSMVEFSPRCVEMERRMEAQEAEWHAAQAEVFRHHG
jgi:hypothetical protein